MDKMMKLIRQQYGFGILEIMIAILIFAIGMLALASLQGSLTRSSADASLRTTAANIAERTIEDLRGFGRIDTDPSGTINAYADIANDTSTVTDGVIPFTRTITVTDYYYDLAGDTFTTSAPIGAAYSDFKEVTVTVAWGADSGFETDDANTISSAELGSGSISTSAFISSTTTQGSSSATTQDADEDFVPFVNYTPGANPDIVSLTLGQNKFKESLTPAPEVYRSEELIETSFNVITYSQTADASLFLRREEFLAVSCDCILRAAPNDGSTSGRRPTIWAGDEYTEPEFVAKAYGENFRPNSQSRYCDTCCQDHHDGGEGSNDPDNDDGAILFNPYRDKDDYHDSGDHFHYKKSAKGNLSLASVGDVYVEACRLVRKDGFFRVAQDFSMEGLNVFPYDYLLQTVDVTNYSTWLTGAVSDFSEDLLENGYGSSGDFDFVAPNLAEPSLTTYENRASPADSDLTKGYTFLPTPLGRASQQLRSRGIYVDYMSTDLRGMVNCLATNTLDYCNNQDFGDVILDKTSSTNTLEIIPFFEVQLTYLNTWVVDPIIGPVEVSSEPVATGNTHDRGTARKVANSGRSRVSASGQRGVLGFTDTDPIDLNFNNHKIELAEIDVIITGDTTPNPSGKKVTFTITSGVPGVQARSVELLESSQAVCVPTDGVPGFSCLVPSGTTGATFTLFNYHKNNDNDISACSNSDTLPSTSSTTTANRPFTVFNLDTALGEDQFIYQISIESGSCS